MRPAIVLALTALALGGCIKIGDIDVQIDAPRRAFGAEPLVIAHRGASDYLPEHTLEAYTLAYQMRADFIEPDVVFTRDRVAICAHDITMEQTTNVETLFPDRARTDGSWYWIDFDLAEIKTLSKHDRGSSDADAAAGGYDVATLEEMIRLLKRLDDARYRGMNQIMLFGLPIGIIPELKKPAFYVTEAPGFDPAAELVRVLETHGYSTRMDQCIIQCFDLNTIEHLATLTDLRLVWLTADTPSDEALDRAAAVAHGVGPNRGLLENEDGSPKPLLADLGRRSLAIYPWTFSETIGDIRTRGDQPSPESHYQTMRRFMYEHNVTGIFADNPDAAVYLRTHSHAPTSESE